MSSCGDFWMYCEPMSFDETVKLKLAELKVKLNSIHFTTGFPKKSRCDGDEKKNSEVGYEHFVCHDWGCSHCRNKRGNDKPVDYHSSCHVGCHD